MAGDGLVILVAGAAGDRILAADDRSANAILVAGAAGNRNRVADGREDAIPMEGKSALDVDLEMTAAHARPESEGLAHLLQVHPLARAIREESLGQMVHLQSVVSPQQPEMALAEDEYYQEGPSPRSLVLIARPYLALYPLLSATP